MQKPLEALSTSGGGVQSLGGGGEVGGGQFKFEKDSGISVLG